MHSTNCIFRLYNKESVLMALLDKSNIPEVASHIRNLKDVVELKLTVNPGYKPSDKADGYNDVQAAQYVCPVTGLEMSGRYRCVHCSKCEMCVVKGRFIKNLILIGSLFFVGVDVYYQRER